MNSLKKIINKKIFIIAEIGNNHGGIVNRAKKLINLAKKNGADAVKFQFIIPAKLVHHKLNAYGNKNSKNKYQIDRLKRICLNLNQLKSLSKFSKKKKILFGLSVFDHESVKDVKKIVDFYKVASSDIDYERLISEINKTKKFTFISTGCSNFNEIKKLKINKNNFCIMHCVSLYPTQDEDLNLNSIYYLKNKLKLKYVGYSDHSSGILAPSVAVAKGAQAIEKHFMFSENDSIANDKQVSLDPKKFKKMSLYIDKTFKSLGTENKKINFKLKKNLASIRRSFYANKNFKKGDKIVESNLIFLRPRVKNAIFKISKNLAAKNDIKKGTPITSKNVLS